MANCGILLNDGTSFLLLNSGDFFLLNDNSCAAEPGADAAVDAGPPPGGYLAWWNSELSRILSERKKKRLPKKKQELVDELEDKADELTLIASEREITESYAKEIRQQVLDVAAIVNQVYEAKVSDARLRAEIRAVEEYVAEMEDEEIIFFALH